MPLSDIDSPSAHLRHGVKTGIAALLAYGITGVMDPRFGMWAVVSSVIVMQMNVADSIRMCWYRVTGTAMGAVIGVVAILVFPNTTVGTGAGVFCAVAFCAYMTRYNPRYRMAAITVSIVLVASVGEENRIAFGMMRVLEITIGVLCSFAVSLWIWPVRVGAALRARLEGQFARLGTAYEMLVEAFLGTPEVGPINEHSLDSLSRDVEANRELFRTMLRHEQPFFVDNASLLDRQLFSLELCVRHLQAMLQVVLDMRKGGYQLFMAEELRAVARVSREAMRDISNGVLPDAESLRPLLVRAETRLEELRASGATKRFNARELAEVLAFYGLVQRMGEDLQKALLEGAHPSIIG